MVGAKLQFLVYSTVACTLDKLIDRDAWQREKRFDEERGCGRKTEREREKKID